eukprot:6023828-Amphidinium_carterae.1
MDVPGDKVYTWHGTLGKLTMLGLPVAEQLSAGQLHSFFAHQGNPTDYIAQKGKGGGHSLNLPWLAKAVHLKILILMLVIASASLGAFLPRLVLLLVARAVLAEWVNYVCTT